MIFDLYIMVHALLFCTIYVSMHKMIKAKASNDIHQLKFAVPFSTNPLNRTCGLLNFQLGSLFCQKLYNQQNKTI